MADYYSASIWFEGSNGVFSIKIDVEYFCLEFHGIVDWDWVPFLRNAVYLLGLGIYSATLNKTFTHIDMVL